MALKTWMGAMLSGIMNVVTHDVWPFVQHLFEGIALDTVQKLAPLAQQALDELEHDLPLLLSQGIEGFLKAFNGTLAGLIQKAEAAGIETAETDLITAAHAAVVNAKKALVPAAPPTV